MTFVPCSQRHKSCSPAHADLVESYRSERYRQEIAHEMTLTAPQELALARENGFKLVTFGDWLKAHKRVRT